jgi:hypothetical protein
MLECCWSAFGSRDSLTTWTCYIYSGLLSLNDLPILHQCPSRTTTRWEVNVWNVFRCSRPVELRPLLCQSSATIPSGLAVFDTLSCVDICFGPMVASCSKYLRMTAHMDRTTFVLLHEGFINLDRLIILHIGIVLLTLHFGTRAPRIPRRQLALSSMPLASGRPSPLWQVMALLGIATAILLCLKSCTFRIYLTCVFQSHCIDFYH